MPVEAPSGLRFRLFILTLSVVFSTMVAVSIQVPAFSTLDVARTSFKNTSNSFGVNEIRFGVWSACLQRSTNKVNACDGFSPCLPSENMRICTPKHYGYKTQVGPTNATSEFFVLNPKWTRALPLLVANAIMTSVVFVLLILHWPSTFISFCAVFIGILTILTEVAFFYHTKNGMRKFNGSIGVNSSVGPGFGLSLIAFFLLLLEERINKMESDDRKERRGAAPPRPNRLPLLPISHIPAPPPTTQTNTGGVSSLAPRLPDAAHTTVSTRLSRTPSIRRSVLVEDGYECPICWECDEDIDARSNIEYSSLPCKHIFCTRCITRALGIASRCPLCNGHSTVADIRPAPRKEKEKERRSWFQLSKAQDGTASLKSS